MRLPKWRYVLFVFPWLMTSAVDAAPCPGPNTSAAFSSASRTGTAAAMHIAGGGCLPGVPSGAATACTTVAMSAFAATWPSTTARTMDATGGCTFPCNLGSCRVGQDGLPVELLDFKVK